MPRSVTLVINLVEEGRLAEACCFLFHLHKYYLDEWLLVKEHVLLECKCTKTLQTFASLFDSSQKQTLDQSVALYPGLRDLILSNRENQNTI